MNTGLLIAVLAGWIAGGLGNWVSDHLPDRRSEALPALVRDWPHYWTLWWRWRGVACPHCGRVRSMRAPLLEIAVAGAFGISWLLGRSQSMPWPVMAGYATFLLIVFVVDLEHRRILNVMLAPMAALALGFSLLPGTPAPTSALLGGTVAFALFGVMYIVGRGRLGAGDVKLAGVIGLMTGYPGVWTALLLGTLLGALAALWVMVVRRASGKTPMAYAPYLSLGALIALWAALGA